MKLGKRTLSSPQVMVLGFAAVILTGALILILPISSAKGSWTSGDPVDHHLLR